MKKVITTIVGLLILIGLALGAYHVISPKVVITNDSTTVYDEFVVRLPSSGVSVGPLKPGSKDTIYISRQGQGGDLTYSLWRDGKELVAGSMPFDVEGQLFRVLSFVINEDGSVSAKTN
jgi:hypothetical protein